MIDARELRYGNYLYTADGYCGRVLFGHRRFVVGHPERGELTIEECAGVELTPEILEKWCGFEKDYDGNLRKKLPARMELWFYGGNPAEMDLRQDGKFISFKHAHVKYLHQLQNLIYALTGEELKVNYETNNFK